MLPGILLQINLQDTSILRSFDLTKARMCGIL
nr:MAG TPA: hypothetical protein [Bacteriophage sp.]